LIAGGSGIVPLMAMLRHRAAHKRMVPTHLLCSSRDVDEIIYHIARNWSSWLPPTRH